MPCICAHNFSCRTLSKNLLKSSAALTVSSTTLGKDTPPHTSTHLHKHAWIEAFGGGNFTSAPMPKYWRLQDIVILCCNPVWLVAVRKKHTPLNASST